MLNASQAIDVIQQKVLRQSDVTEMPMDSDVAQVLITNHSFFRVLLESRSTSFKPEEYLILMGAYLATAQIMSLLAEQFHPKPLSQPVSPQVSNLDLDLLFGSNVQDYLNPKRS